MLIKRLSSVFCLFAIALGADAARAESEDILMPDQGAIINFEYGKSCEELGQLSRVELVGVTHQTYSEQFSLFCKPDSVYRCNDYNSVLIGLGRLEDNGRGSCRFVSGQSL